MTRYYQLIILTTSNKIYKNSGNSRKRGTFMTQIANFAYIVNLLNPYLMDAKGSSVEETTRLLLNHATNNQIKDYSNASVNNFAVNGLTRRVAKSVLGYINKEKSPLSGYLSQIGDDQLTLIASKIKNDGISKDVYRGVVPSYIERWFIEDLERTANRKNKRKQKKPTDKKSERTEVLSKTVSDKEFSTVFNEIAVEKMPTSLNQNAIHAFILKPELFPFSYKKLEKLVMLNITNYAVARGFERDEVTGYKVGQLLRNYAESGIPQNLLGEVLTYVFLEHVENARKLYTRAEISNYSKTINSEGIYLRNGEGILQLILGASQLNDNLQDAVNSLASKLKAFRNNKSDELIISTDLIDESILDAQYSDEDSKKILQILLPEENNVDEIASYGLFIGYRFKPNENLDKCTSKKAKNICKQTVKDDLKQVISQLSKEIQSNKWQKSSFYVYMLPFMSAEKDGDRIMSNIIGGYDYGGTK